MKIYKQIPRIWVFEWRVPTWLRCVPSRFQNKTATLSFQRHNPPFKVRQHLPDPVPPPLWSNLGFRCRLLSGSRRHAPPPGSERGYCHPCSCRLGPTECHPAHSPCLSYFYSLSTDFNQMNEMGLKFLGHIGEVTFGFYATRDAEDVCGVFSS